MKKKLKKEIVKDLRIMEIDGMDVIFGGLSFFTGIPGVSLLFSQFSNPTGNVIGNSANLGALLGLGLCIISLIFGFLYFKCRKNSN